MPQKVYLDDSGNPIQAPAKVYLDEQGNPVEGGGALKFTLPKTEQKPDPITNFGKDVAAEWAATPQDTRPAWAKAVDWSTTSFIPPELALKTSESIVGMPQKPLEYSWSDIPGAIPQVLKGLWHEPTLTARRFLAGAQEGAATLVNPFDIATTLLGFGSAKAARGAVGAVGRATDAGQALAAVAKTGNATELPIIAKELLAHRQAAQNADALRRLFSFTEAGAGAALSGRGAERLFNEGDIPGSGFVGTAELAGGLSMLVPGLRQGFGRMVDKNAPLLNLPEVASTPPQQTALPFEYPEAAAILNARGAKVPPKGGKGSTIYPKLMEPIVAPPPEPPLNYPPAATVPGRGPAARGSLKGGLPPDQMAWLQPEAAALVPDVEVPAAAVTPPSVASVLPEPTTAPTTAAEVAASKARRTLSPGEEKGIQDLDLLMTAIHGPDWKAKGNGLLPAEPPVAPPPKPPVVEAGTAGECFRNVNRWNARYGEKTDRIVHGKVTNGEGKTFDHAWIERGETVIDPTTGVEMPKGQYYATLAAQPESSYSSTEAIRNQIRAKHHGPWTPEELGQKPPAGATTEGSKPPVPPTTGGPGRSLLNFAGPAASMAIPEDPESEWDNYARAALMGAGGVGLGASLMGKPKVGWYSRLLKAAQERLPAKVHPSKIMSIAQNFASKDEIEWSGLKGWVNALGNKPVAKEEVLRFLEEHRLPEPGVVRKGGKGTPPQARMREIEREVERIYHQPVGEGTSYNPNSPLLTIPADEWPVDVRARFNSLRDELAELENDFERHVVGGTKYGPGSSYGTSLVLEGGEPGSYGETLLTLPPPDETPYRQRRQAILDELDNQVPEGELVPDELRPRRRELLAELDKIETKEWKRDSFRGPHWDEPDVIVHTRHDIRTTTDDTGVAKRTLFIQEDQSDWHQSGKKEGYKFTLDPAEEAARHKQLETLREASVAAYAAYADIIRFARETSRQQLTGPQSYDFVKSLADAGQEAPAKLLKAYIDPHDAISNIELPNPNAVPNAPWKKSWPLLGVKQAIKDAIEQGLDRVAWTTGRQQARRYNRLLEGITLVERRADGGLTIEHQQGRRSLAPDTEEFAELKRMLTPEQWETLRWNGVIDLSSSPLTISPKGFALEYDEQLVQETSKYLTERGGTPVRRLQTKTGRNLKYTPEQEALMGGEKTIPREEVWGFDITPQLRDTLIREGQPLGAISPTLLAQTGSTLGGAVGGSLLPAESTEERLKNAAVGAGLGLVGSTVAAGALPYKGLPSITSTLPANIRARLASNTPKVVTSGWQQLKKGADYLKNGVETIFSFESDLKKAGLHDAVDDFSNFRSQNLDINQRAFDDLKTILKPLQDPGRYEDFWAIVRLRRDVNLHRMHPQAAGEMNVPIQDTLKALNFLEATAPPEVKAAAQAHRDLMQRIGSDLVQRGELQATTVQRNSEYFPDVVMSHLDERQGFMSAKGRIRWGKRGWELEHKGGERETLHDYGKVMLDHLRKVYGANVRDDLVTRLSTKYDLLRQPNNPVTFQGGKAFGIPTGFKLWSYGTQTHIFPTVLADRLNRSLGTPPWLVDALNKATNKIKGPILRTVWGAYNIGNFLGDNIRLFTFDESFNPLKIAKAEWNAGRATYLLMTNADPAKLGPHDQTLLAAAKLGKQTGLGTGAATGEMGARVQFDPQLRKLTRPTNANLGHRLIRSIGDTVVWGMHKQDLAREFLENTPRQAEFMLSLDRGHPPQMAAKVAKKVLLDYTELTPDEETFFRGMLFPFYTFYKKNLESMIPGLATDAAGSKLGGAKMLARAEAKLLGAVTAVEAWNMWVCPEGEKSLSDRDKHTLHINIPWTYNEDGSVKELYQFRFPGPFNLAAKQVGMGGMVPRVVDMIRQAKVGIPVKEIARRQYEIGKQQASEGLFGLVSPFFSETYAQVAGEDLRTGTNLFPATASPKEEMRGRLEHLTTRTLPPTAQWYRTARETTGGSDTLATITKRYLFGNFLQKQNIDDNVKARLWEGYGKAVDRMQEKSAADKKEMAQPLAQWFGELGPETTDFVVGGLWKLGSGEQQNATRAVLVEALRSASAGQKAFVPLMHKYSLANQDIGEKKLPHLVLEVLKTFGEPQK